VRADAVETELLGDCKAFAACPDRLLPLVREHMKASGVIEHVGRRARHGPASNEAGRAPHVLRDEVAAPLEPVDVGQEELSLRRGLAVTGREQRVACLERPLGRSRARHPHRESAAQEQPRTLAVVDERQCGVVEANRLFRREQADGVVAGTARVTRCLARVHRRNGFDEVMCELRQVRFGVAAEEGFERFADRLVQPAPAAGGELVVDTVAEQGVAKAQQGAAAGYLGHELLGDSFVEHREESAALQPARGCEQVEVELAPDHRRDRENVLALRGQMA
jgi:hypothetical protein